jgi:hypothetical protein
LREEFELVCSGEFVTVSLFVISCGTKHGLPETRYFFVSKPVKDLFVILFAFLLTVCLFGL